VAVCCCSFYGQRQTFAEHTTEEQISALKSRVQVTFNRVEHNRSMAQVGAYNAQLWRHRFSPRKQSSSSILVQSEEPLRQRETLRLAATETFALFLSLDFRFRFGVPRDRKRWWTTGCWARWRWHTWTGAGLVTGVGVVWSATAAVVDVVQTAMTVDVAAARRFSVDLFAPEQCLSSSTSPSS